MAAYSLVAELREVLLNVHGHGLRQDDFVSVAAKHPGRFGSGDDGSDTGAADRISWGSGVARKKHRRPVRQFNGADNVEQDRVVS
jgi:hypothetical protein